MNPVEQSLLVLTKEWPGIIGLLGIFLLGGAALALWLRTIFKERLTAGEYFALGAGGALLPLMLGVGLVVLLNRLWRGQNGFIWVWGLLFVAMALLAARGANWRTGGWKAPSLAFIALVVVALGSIFMRLAFLNGLQVPLYFDSAMHYSIITDLLKNFASAGLPDFKSFVGGYYHLGFHALTGAISLALNLPTQKAMLLIGQLLLALLPLPLFFIIRQETGREAPALFAVLLAGWGWYMPAHLLDWGKYPALASMLSFEFALCSLYLLRLASGRMRWALAGLALASILLSTFIHTRSLVLIGMAIASAVLAAGWNRLQAPLVIRALPPTLVIASLTALAFVTQSRPILNLALDPYLPGRGWMGLLVLVLLPLALLAHPRATFTCLLLALFMTGSMYISVTRFLPVYEAQTLLDRPYVEGTLFFLLAVLGGLGYAGLLKLLKNSGFWEAARKTQIAVLVTICLFGTFFAQLTRYNFAPSDCCKLYSEQDTAAFEWMDKNIPATGVNILIASFETVVFDSDQPAGYSGADAGIWITPLIHRNVVLVPFQTDFNTLDGLVVLCKKGGGYLYAGDTKQSFNKTQLENRPEWYARQLTLPGIEIYRVTGCP